MFGLHCQFRHRSTISTYVITRRSKTQTGDNSLCAADSWELFDWNGALDKEFSLCNPNPQKHTLFCLPATTCMFTPDRNHWHSVSGLNVVRSDWWPLFLGGRYCLSRRGRPEVKCGSGKISSSSSSSTSPHLFCCCLSEQQRGRGTDGKWYHRGPLPISPSTTTTPTLSLHTVTPCRELCWPLMAAGGARIWNRIESCVPILKNNILMSVSAVATVWLRSHVTHFVSFPVYFLYKMVKNS